MGHKIILLLDVDPNIQKVVESGFVETEYQIISLNVGLPSLEDTLEKIRNISPNMILLDFELPGVGGKSLCKKLKEDPSLADVPVILLVRELDKYSTGKLAEYGADRILGKPFDAFDLVRLVDECFNPAKRLEVSGRVHPGAMPDLEKWLRKIVEEKVEEILMHHLEEIVTDRLEKFFQGRDFLNFFQESLIKNENEIYQTIISNSHSIIEDMAGKVVPEQAKIMIQQEIDRIKNGD